MQKVSYTGNGSTTDFYFNFPFYTNTDIIVLKNNQTATDYTVVGTSAGLNADIPYTGGKIVFNDAPAATENITIYRYLPLTRIVDYQPTEKINPTILNQDMNYIMEILKDMHDKIDTFSEQYNDIINKESTDNLLSKINYLNQLIDNDEIINKYTSNCITKIPKNLKLELSSGTLTLKAGSKLFIPNGVGVFDTYTLTTDKTLTSANNGGNFVWFNTNTNLLRSFPISLCSSGSTAPSGYTYMLWYDTTNNAIKITEDGGNTWTDGQSLPIGIMTGNASNQIVSLDRIFNGFGYIGSTMFVLPGFKGLIPNGKNTDGTLKNTVLNISDVITQTFTGTANTVFAIQQNGVSEGSNIWYNATDNYVYNSPDSTTPFIALPVANATITSGKISNWNPKTSVFHTTDYNDVANLSMPSKKYIDLTLGVSGTSYIAPADGYFTINKGGSDGEWMYLMDNSTNLSMSVIYSTNINGRLFIPVAKGRSIQIQYTASGTTNMFRFVYANCIQ